MGRRPKIIGPKKANDDLNSIRALDTGLGLLRVVAQLRRASTLSEIAAASGMTPSRVHRYIVSLVRCGFVTQDPESGRYDLGNALLQLGAIAMSRLDVIRLGSEALVRLSELTGLDSLLATWGTNGPTVIKWEHGLRGYAVKVTEGRNLPLMLSATGRVFLTFLPEPETKEILKRELVLLKAVRSGDRLVKMDHIRSMQQEIREHGMARALSDFSPSIAALSAPVFDQNGRLSIALTILGVAGSFSTEYDGAPARQLRKVSQELSARLGSRCGSYQAALKNAGLERAQAATPQV
jgi:DNA-binding IclR family transcriptional regulator